MTNSFMFQSGIESYEPQITNVTRKSVSLIAIDGI